MGEPNYVIGSHFIAPYPLEIIVDTISKGNLVITDINHKIIFKVKPCNTIFHHRRLILDADDRPIVTLQDKLTSETKWKAFRGDSKSKSNLMFSTKKAHMIQFKTNVNVFLANNKRKKDVFDFKIKGSWSKRNCSIYVGNSSTIIARMRKIKKSENKRFTKDKFILEVYPNVDYAFVVALIAIVDAMKDSTTNDEVAAAVIDTGVQTTMIGAGS